MDRYIDKNSKDGILKWVPNHNIVVIDCSFRDSTGMIQALVLDICMPNFLNGRFCFDAFDANRSRFNSNIRWVIESKNSRIKHFKRFSQTIRNSMIPQIHDYLQIFCVLINVYHAPIVPSSSNDNQIAVQMLACLRELKLLHTRSNNEHLYWSNNDASDLVDFAVLTTDYILLIAIDI